MSSVVLSGDTSGTVTLTVPAVAGTNTVTIANQTGTLNAAAPAFCVSNSSGTSIASATVTKVALNTEAFDTNNNFDSTTNYRFTPTIAGYYQINAVVGFSSGAGTGVVGALIYKNGVEFADCFSYYYTTSGLGYASISQIINFNGSTDYIELYAYQNTGVSQTLGTSPKACTLSGALVRGA
jgi:hypothetical protein